MNNNRNLYFVTNGTRSEIESELRTFAATVSALNAAGIPFELERRTDAAITLIVGKGF